MKTLKRFMRDDDGQDLIEYAILLGLITLAALSTAKAVGAFVATTFSTLLDLVS